MPGIDGHETCKRIKAIDGLGSKIVVITGDLEAIDAHKAKRMGADEYCVKTLDYGILTDIVKKLL